MITIAVTGILGSGKTTVAGMFGSRGLPVIDADAIAHELMEPGTEVWRKIKEVFGENVLENDKTINRQKLAEMVFGEESRVSKLNEIVHPELFRVILDKLRGDNAGKNPAVVIDAPLLIESGLHREMDYVVVVKTDRKNARERIRRSGRKIDFEARMRFQLPQESKEKHADFIVDNNGGFSDAGRQVEKIWETIREKHKL